MQSYEVVREVENLCANNQMRDIFFEEIETDDPVGWLRDFVKGKDVELTVAYGGQPVYYYTISIE